MASQSRFVYLSNSDSTFILQRREYPTHSRKRPLKKSHEATVSETLCNVKSRYVVPLGDFLSGLLRLWVGYSRRWRIIFHDGTGLLDCDLQIVRRHAIHRHIHVHFAAPCQAAWQRHIELIQSDERSLRSGTERVHVHAADLHADRTERVSIAQARPEQNQEDVVGRRIQINRCGDELLSHFVEAHHRFKILRAIRLHPQGDTDHQALSAGVG